MKYYAVSIPFENHGRLREVEDRLHAKGISFDTGSGFGMRDWELDWSLKGATPDEVLQFLKDECPDLYKVVEIYPRDSED